MPAGVPVWNRSRSPGLDASLDPYATFSVVSSRLSNVRSTHLYSRTNRRARRLSPTLRVGIFPNRPEPLGLKSDEQITFFRLNRSQFPRLVFKPSRIRHMGMTMDPDLRIPGLPLCYACSQTCTDGPVSTDFLSARLGYRRPATLWYCP